MIMQLVFVLFAVLLRPVWSTTNDLLDKLEAVTQCHASCLDEFTEANKSVENCKKESSCSMCWETCSVLIENAVVWRGLCSVPEICLSGCDKACSFVLSEKNYSEYPLATMFLTSSYDQDLDQFTLEWAPDFNMNGERSVIYAVLLKDHDDEWHLITETTSQVVFVKRSFVHWDIAFRVIALDSRGKVSDNETSLIKSYIDGSKLPLKGASTKISETTQWKPQLESMVMSDSSAGLLTTITWPTKNENQMVDHYELSWNVIDDSMEITGHLHSSQTSAAITLWPDSVYSVQVLGYQSDNTLLFQSDPLIIDTRDSRSTATMICKAEMNTTPVLTYSVVTGLFVIITIAAFAIFIRRSRRSSPSGISGGFRRDVLTGNPTRSRMYTGRRQHQGGIDIKGPQLYSICAL